MRSKGGATASGGVWPGVFRPITIDTGREGLRHPSRTQRCASNGSFFQMVGQGDSTSTREKPNPFTWFSMAR